MVPQAIDLAPFHLSICGIDELPHHGCAGITHVVSILDPGCPEPNAFAAFTPHRRLELRFHDVIEPSAGHLMPDSRDIENLLAFGRELREGSHVLIHCHAGQSRSTASAVLVITQARPDLPMTQVFTAVVQLRPRAWPNLRMLELGDRLLYRNGAIIAAARSCYLRRLESDPLLADALISEGRGREVQAAYGSTFIGRNPPAPLQTTDCRDRAPHRLVR